MVARWSHAHGDQFTSRTVQAGQVPCVPWHVLDHTGPMSRAGEDWRRGPFLVLHAMNRYPASHMTMCNQCSCMICMLAARLPAGCTLIISDLWGSAAAAVVLGAIMCHSSCVLWRVTETKTSCHAHTACNRHVTWLAGSMLRAAGLVQHSTFNATSGHRCWGVA